MRFGTTIGLILILSVLGLTYEIAAGRVLAPFFGTSLVTWTTVIATVLAGFSLGSALGGLIAEQERAVAARKVRLALVVTAVLMALSPTVLALIYAMGARGTGGMFFAVVVAFFPASVLVSFPSPFLAKLAVEARPGREGSSLGLVLAAGSMGAIFGAVLAGFVLLPLIGSSLTFAGCGLAALLCVPFVRGSGPDDAALTSVVPAGLVVAVSVAGGSVCEYESGLSCIDVQVRDGEIIMFSDRTAQAAEPLDAQDKTLALSYTQHIWARMERDLAAGASVLFIGGGGYTLPTQLLATEPDARAVAVEIDPLVTRVVAENLPRASDMMAESPERMQIVHADGRQYINETAQHFDAVVMDAFSSGSVPAHLVTLETYARLREINAGPVYVNLIDVPDGRLARGTFAILNQLFDHVDAVRGPVSARGYANYVLAAGVHPFEPLAALPEGYEPAAINPGRAFTDDRGWIGHR